MDGIHKIREKLHARILLLRSIEGTLSSIRFERLWSDSDKKQRKEVLDYLDAEDKEAIVTWLRNHPSLDVAELPLSRIKELAQKLRIRYYSRLGKLELIRAIREIEDGSKQS